MVSGSGTRRLGPDRAEPHASGDDRSVAGVRFDPAPELVDPAAGIRLRPWTTRPADVDALVAAWADPAIAAANRVPDDVSAGAAARWLAADADRRRAGRSLDLVVSPLGDAEGGPGAADDRGVDPVVSPLSDHRGDAGGPKREDRPRTAPDRTGPVAVLGEVGLRNVDRRRGRAEMSWWIAAEHRGRGLASAAVDLLAAWALSPTGGGLVQVWARIAPDNAASARSAAAAGFVELGAAAGTRVWARTAVGDPRTR